MSEKFLNFLDFFVLGVPKCQKNHQVPKSRKIPVHTTISYKASEFSKYEIFIGISMSDSTRQHNFIFCVINIVNPKKKLVGGAPQHAKRA